MEYTFFAIKPDAVAAGNAKAILDIVQNAGFLVKHLCMKQLSVEEANELYCVHKGKGFYEEVIAFMTEGIGWFVVLEKENAVRDLRALVGNTDPQKALPNTIRATYGTDKTHNAVHSSDSVDSAKREMNVIFPELSRQVERHATINPSPLAREIALSA